MNETEKDRQPSITPDILAAALNANERIVLEMLINEFGGRVTATLGDNGAITLNIIPLQAHQAAVDLRTRLATPKLDFDACSPNELREFLKPDYADVINPAKLQAMWKTLAQKVSLDELDLFVSLLKHPHISTKIVTELAELIFTIPNDKLAGDDEKINAVKEVLFGCMTSPVASSETCKTILMIPHFVDFYYQNHESRPVLEAIFNALKKSALTAEDIEKILIDPSQHTTILRFLDTFASQLPDGIMLGLRCSQAYRNLSQKT